MIKITRKDIIEVRQHERIKWHDQAWWNFHNLKKTENILRAIFFCDEGATYKEIAAKAAVDYE